jgi:hypothetical protein
VSDSWSYRRRPVGWTTILAAIVGAAGAAAKYLDEYLKGAPFRWLHLPISMLVGSFLALMGDSFATGLGFGDHYRVGIAGAIGASGSWGFEVGRRVAMRLLGLSDTDTPRHRSKRKRK